MRVLITGANGQLGKCLSDRLTSSSALFCNSSELDISDPRSINDAICAYKPNVIVNCAAYTQVDKAESDVDRAFEVNALGPKYLAQQAVENGIHLIHISTDYVFDGTAKKPYREEQLTNPQSVYGNSKRQGENYIVDSGCRYTILRTAWVFSEYGNNFLKTMIHLFNNREQLSIVNDQMGAPTYAGDIAQAIIDLIGQLENVSIHNQIFHFCGDSECSWYDFATSILAQYQHLLGNEIRIHLNPIPTSQYPTAATRPAYSVMDCDKLRAATSIIPSDWNKAIKKVLQKLNVAIG